MKSFHLTVFLIFVVGVASFVTTAAIKTSGGGPFRVLRGGRQQQDTKRLQPLSAELRLLIHGTKNAYTTARTGDILSYKLTEEVDGKAVRLGELTGSGNIVPLCNRVPHGAEFFHDHTADKLSAEELKSQGRLLRIVSSDRSADDAIVIDEYLDDAICIPVIAEESKTAPHSCNIAIEMAQAELEIAQKKLKLLLEQQKQRGDTLEAVKSSAAPLPVGPYSQAVKTPSTVFASGCIGLDPVSGKLVGGGIEAETVQALHNMQAILKQAGTDLHKIAKTTIFVTDLKQYAVVNKIYADFLKENPIFPARTTVEVSGLPLGALVEIEAIALL